MRVQSVNSQHNYRKTPSFEAVEVKFIENQSKPLTKMFEESYNRVVLNGKNEKFSPLEYMEKFAQGFSEFLEKCGITDGKIQIARAYGPSVKDNTLNATYELGKKHIEERSCVLIEDLFKGKDEMNFMPIIKTLNENAPYTTVRYFSSTENPFRVFEPEKFSNNHKVVVTHQESAKHMGLGKLETGFFERFK